MVCPQDINQDRLCYKCEWDFHQYDLNGDYDTCVCPKNIKKNKEHISSTCYVSGVEVPRVVEYQYPYCKINRDPDPNWNCVPGVDCCGHEGLWFEPRIEYKVEIPKNLWQRFRNYLRG
jgi:hypothetical protein